MQCRSFTLSLRTERSLNKSQAQPHRNEKKKMSPIWFIIRRNQTKCQKSDICRFIRLVTNTAFRRREQHKGPIRQSRVRERSYSTAIEWSKWHLAEVRVPIVTVCIVGSNACWLAYATYWQVCVAGGVYGTANDTANDTQQYRYDVGVPGPQV